MKKGLIAGAAATAALAAMPMAGVFATVTDTITLTVSENCSMTGTAAADEGTSVTLGPVMPGNATGVVNGTAMSVTCNDADGWTITYSANALSDGTNSIPFGDFSTSGSSVWSASAATSDTTNVTIAAGWLNGAYAPGAATGTVATGIAGSAVVGVTVTPSYKAYVGASQQAGTYTGTIVYTFAQL